MKRASWIMGSLAAFLLAACGGGAADRDQGTTTGGTDYESGSMGDTSTMAPGATPMDTALTGTGTTGLDTAGDTLR